MTVAWLGQGTDLGLHAYARGFSAAGELQGSDAEEFWKVDGTAEEGDANLSQLSLAMLPDSSAVLVGYLHCHIRPRWPTGNYVFIIRVHHLGGPASSVWGSEDLEICGNRNAANWELVDHGACGLELYFYLGGMSFSHQRIGTAGLIRTCP